MSRLRALCFFLSGALLLAAAIAWLARFRVAESLVSRRLAAAGVPAAYRLTKIGPFSERIESVRIGDPASPDLAAGAIDVDLAYGLSGPSVRAVRASGVRLRGRLDAKGLSLGALDRLLPRSGGGGAVLPDLDLALRDARLTLATPNGTVVTRLEGSGNPQRVFHGVAEVRAGALRVASCTMRGVRARFALSARRGAPEAVGPLWIDATACPDVALGAGRAGLSLTADPTLRRIAARMLPAGFAGRAGPARFADVTGAVQAAGRIGALDLRGHASLSAVAFPAAARQLRTAGSGLAGTPFVPTAARAEAALATLVSGAAATIDLDASVRGREVAVSVRKAALQDDTGARLQVAEQGGIRWSPAGLRVDAAIAAGGGALPAIAGRIAQAGPGAAYDARLRVDRYAAGGATLAVPRLHLAWDGRQATIEALVRADGPIGGTGTVRGLVLPVVARVDAAGGFSLGDGCRPVSFDALRLASFDFGDGRLTLCGSPLVGRAPNGTTHVRAAIPGLALAGRTRGGAGLRLVADAVHVSDRSFTVENLGLTIGEGATPTRLGAAALAGTFDGGTLAGPFSGASARIGSVPLLLSDAAGDWRYADGVLALAGDLHVADAASSPRFRTLRATQAALKLEGNAIQATATLREPTSDAPIAAVSLAHDLGTGAGDARLTVEKLRFTPKGLQPDALTPLTVGVIANVEGEVTGQGRIAWDGDGVRSTGSFGTDGLDLAAAFGPVHGIKARIDFTDLLNLVSAPHQVATVAEVNPGVAISDGVVRFSLIGQNRLAVEGAQWPFAGGTLRLDPTTLDFGADTERHLTFRVAAMDAAAFVQELEFPNLAATGTFDGALPMIFGPAGGRVVGGSIASRSPGGTLAYVGELSSARLGTMGKIAFDALKAIRFSTLRIDLGGPLDGEMVSRVTFTGVREATADRGLVARMIRNLPFRFNITIRAPFRGLVGTARSYMEPQLLLEQSSLQAPPAIQPPASGNVR